MVYSLSLSSGWLITFGGYNRSQHSLTMAASSICLIHFFITIVASLFTFGIWGIQMHENTFDIKTGFNLGFIEIPKTLSQLPATNFTSIMFFSMMFLFCINTASAYMLTILSCFYDLVRNLKLCIWKVKKCFRALCSESIRQVLQWFCSLFSSF